jgi:hypothetical protein
MKATNYHYYDKDAATVQRLKEEYEYIGRYVVLESPYHLVVLAYPPKKEPKKKNDNRTKGRGSNSQGRRKENGS